MSATQSWVEVRLCCPLGWQELAAQALGGEPCTAVAFGTVHDGRAASAGCTWVTSYIAAADDTSAVREEIRARWLALAAASGEAAIADLELEFHPLPPEDYANSWKKSWRPFRVGRLCVVPSWSRVQLRAKDVRLCLEPGGAFGSGRHATTRMCLQALQERLRGGERVLDAGSGSGILAVAACLLGAQTAVGFDMDRHALPAAAELALKNGLCERAEFHCAGFEVLERLRLPFDVVLANIYTDVLMAHASDLRRALAPQAWFALSGCPREHLPELLRALEQAGLAVAEVRSRGRWRTILGGKA